MNELVKGCFYKGKCAGATSNYSKNKDKDLNFIPVDDKNVLWFSDQEFKEIGGTYPIEWFKDIEQIERHGIYVPGQYQADEEGMQLTLL